MYYFIEIACVIAEMWLVHMFLGSFCAKRKCSILQMLGVYGLFGAIIATAGICVPSFVVMYLVSLFYEQFMEIRIIAAAFKGIQICMVYLIASAGLKMLKKMKKTVFNKVVYAVACVGMIVCSLLDIRVSSVTFIFAAGLAGLAVFFLKTRKEKEVTK